MLLLVHRLKAILLFEVVRFQFEWFRAVRRPCIVLMVRRWKYQRVWVRWEVCGGRIIRIMLWNMQWIIKSRVTWLSCPSEINICVFPFALSRVLGSKQQRNYSSPCMSLVQPLELAKNLQLSAISAGIQESESDSPLKMTSGEISVPSIQIHSTAVTHS